MYNMETILEEIMIKTLTQSADKFMEEGDYEQAKRMFFNALRLSEKLVENSEEKFLPLVSQISNSIAVMYEEVNIYDLAIKYYRRAISIDKKIEVDLEKIANSYLALGNLCRRDFRYEDAERYYTKALNIYLDLPVSKADSVETKVLNIYHHLSIICSAMGKVQETKDAYMNLLNIYKDLVTDEDDNHKPELAMVLFNLGTLYFKHNRRNKASEVYLFALELLLYLDSKDTHNVYKEKIAHTLHNLGQIYTEQLDYPAALSAYREALNHFIDLADGNPSRYGSEVALVFKNLASFYRQQNRMDLAEYFHLRQIELYRELNYYNDSTYDFVLASALIEGVEYYGQHSITLYEAEAILRHYEDEMQVEEVLEKISILREEMSFI